MQALQAHDHASRSTIAPRADRPRTHTLRDGTHICVRPIRAADYDLHAAMVASLSPRTGYLRLLSPRKPQPDELRRMTDIDRTRELALIATVRHEDGTEEEIAVVRYVRDDEDMAHGSAQFAVVVRDAWQRRGLAELLLRQLIDAAREDGIEKLSDVTLYDNHAMLALARKLGFRLFRDAGQANVTRITMQLG